MSADQPKPRERNAGQLKDGEAPSRKADELPDGGGDDDKGEDEAPPE
jgi:hypothetical protein